MDRTVPTGAAMLLDFIGGIEAPKGYGTIFANKQSKLAKPLTEMTLDEVLVAQKAWSKNHGSSAADGVLSRADRPAHFHAAHQLPCVLREDAGFRVVCSGLPERQPLGRRL